MARDIYTNNNDLLVLYTHSGSENESMHYVYHQVLKHIKFQDGENPHRSIVEGNKPLFSNLYEAPFFYQDAKHVFFIEPELHLPLVKDYPFYGVFLNDITGAKEITFPKLIVKTQIDMADKSKFEGHKIKDLGYSKLSKEIDFLQNRLPLKKILCYNGVVSLGDVKVGPMGSKYANVTYNGKINGKYEWISGGNG